MNHENKRQPVHFLHTNDKALHRIDNGQVQYLSKIFGWIDLHFSTEVFAGIEQWENYSGRKVVAILKEKKTMYYLLSGKKYIYRVQDVHTFLFPNGAVVDVWDGRVWGSLSIYDTWKDWEEDQGPKVAVIIHKIKNDGGKV